MEQSATHPGSEMGKSLDLPQALCSAVLPVSDEGC